MPHTATLPFTAALTAALAIAALPSAAQAAPGLAAEVYGATVEPQEWEIESNFGLLSGGPDNGENAAKIELGYGLTGHTRLGAIVEFEKERGSARKWEAAGIEVIQNVGRIGPIDVALYAEYEAVRGGTDALEGKLLLEYRNRLTDLRFNLQSVKPLAAAAPVQWGYAASADVSVAENLRLGLTAFGDLGTFGRLAPYAQHFAGPTAKFRIHGLGTPLKVETGYLFALAAAKADAAGMFRLNLEFEL